MKTIIRNLALGLGLGLPGLGLAQGTFLADPADSTRHAVTVAPGGNVGIGAEPAPDFKVRIEGNVRLGVNMSIGRSGGGYDEIGYNLGFTDQTDRYTYIVPDTAASIRIGAQGGIQFRTAPYGERGEGLSLTERMAISEGGVSISGGVSVADDLVMASGVGEYGHGRLRAVSPGDLIGLTLNSTTRVWDLISITSGGSDYFAIYDHTASKRRLLINEDGNVGIGTDYPDANLDVAGKVRCAVLELTSDRAAKDEVKPVDAREVLGKLAILPISTWHYTNAPTVRHIGPMAQDFKAAFGVGESDKHISVVDGLGVAFAAIQGLNQKLEGQLAEKDARIAALERELHSLRSDVANRLAALEQRAGEPALQPVETTIIPSASLAAVGQPR